MVNVYDYVKDAYRRGFRLLVGVWSEGAAVVPINFQLLSSRERSNRRQEMDGSIDKCAIGHKRRLRALGKENDVTAGFIILARNSKIFSIMC
ncbi:MAG: hypothetical protein FWG10_11140 [Eubacteriaceae bacterium]|nr:hypothetical protein [Eubacteriaceae bacterium]